MATNTLEELQAQLAKLKEDEKRLLATMENERVKRRIADCSMTQAYLLYLVQVPYNPHRTISHHKTMQGAQKACAAFNNEHKNDDHCPSASIVPRAFLLDQVLELAKWDDTLLD
jgi:hypothetical protein